MHGRGCVGLQTGDGLPGQGSFSCATHLLAVAGHDCECLGIGGLDSGPRLQAFTTGMADESTLQVREVECRYTEESEAGKTQAAWPLHGQVRSSYMQAHPPPPPPS